MYSLQVGIPRESLFMKHFQTAVGYFTIYLLLVSIYTIYLLLVSSYLFSVFAE